MRFTLIDRITSIDPGKSISAVKNLSLGEEVGETLLGRGGDVILEEVYGEGFALPQQP